MTVGEETDDGEEEDDEAPENDLYSPVSQTISPPASSVLRMMSASASMTLTTIITTEDWSPAITNPLPRDPR